MARHEIVSPLPGVFYRHPDPNSPPYAAEGDHVEIGQTVGLVEIMKQFHEIKSTVTGKFESYAVEDRAEVEPGAVLAHVEVAQ